jgi:hypothetical protein
LQQIVREQAFTVLNRLAALRMMEARGLLFESVSQGYQSKGFQLYQHVAHALGEVGIRWRDDKGPARGPSHWRSVGLRLAGV